MIGEILAGVVLGPALLGRFAFVSGLLKSADSSHALTFIYWLGLLLLMFLSGAETQQLFGREERREVSWLAIVGTGLPFVLGLAFGPWLVRPSLAGPHGNRISLILVLAVGVAVTSVPVVSKIFADLKILHTRFAGFRGLDLINLAVTTNARGGPGIVLASVAFDAGIISPKFFTTLILAAVLTSQIAGAWLDYVLRKGWPLLKPAADMGTVVSTVEIPSAL